LEGYKLFIGVEPGDEQVAEYCQGLDFMPTNVVINPHRLGVKWNPFETISRAFDSGSLLNVALEDDVILAPDALDLVNYFYGLESESFFCLGLFNYHSNPQLPGLLELSGHFAPLGWAATRKRWLELLKPNWPADDRGWDFAFNRALDSNRKLKVLQPKWSRSTHIGREGGTHCTPDYHDKTFGHLSISDGTTRSYVVYGLGPRPHCPPRKVTSGLSLSVIMPYYKKFSDFRQVLPLNYRFLNKRHIEVILCLDEDSEQRQVLELTAQYKDIQWRVIACHETHAWRPPCKAINVGIRHAQGEHILILSPESAFVNDVPSQVLSHLETFPESAICGRLNHSTFDQLADCRDVYQAMVRYQYRLSPGRDGFEVPQFYGSVAVSRQKAVEIGGYDECLAKWGGDDDNFRARLQLAGVSILKTADVNIVHLGASPRQPGWAPLLKKDEDRIVRPAHLRCPQCSGTWGTAFDDIVTDYGKASAAAPSVIRSTNGVPKHLNGDEQAYQDLDVLHLGYHIRTRHSIGKIIENIIWSCKGLRQNWLSFSPGKTTTGFNEDLVLAFINQVRPKILHLHFSSVFEKAWFRQLAYRPAIVCTVHGTVTNPYREFVDLLICIHQPCYDKNTGERVIIESSPLLDKGDIAHTLDNNHQVSLAARFAPYCMSEDTVRLYGSLKGEVFMYGYSDCNSAARDVRRWSSPFSNIHLVPWNNFVEKEIVKHSIYAFIPPVFNSHLCYGMNVMEAVALGIPTVAVPRASRREYVVDGYNGFVARSREEFVEKGNLLLSDDRLYATMKKNALAHAAALPNPMPLEYEAVYRRFLGG
jgi:hypothetical protein